jgi:hypothetical protein
VYKELLPFCRYKYTMMTHHIMANWYTTQRTVLLLLATFWATTPLNAMIVGADTLSLSDKKITLLADRHGACVEGAQQLEHCMAILAKIHKPLHILVEQPPDLYYQYAHALGVLTGITKRIRQGTLPSITTENIEIRPVAWAAYFILSAKHTDDIDADARCNEHDAYCLEDITFQSIIDEFNANKAMLEQAFASMIGTHMQHTSIGHIEKATNALTLLQAQMKYHQIEPSNTILTYKQKTGTSDVNADLAKIVLDCSSPFIELNIMHKIITSSHQALTVIAGFHHTSKVVTMLFDAHARHLYSAGSPLGSTPITHHELTKALTIQPHSALIKYGTVPIACCLLAAVWYCYHVMQTTNSPAT